MDMLKGLLLFTVITAVGIYVLPPTLSIFLGQHDWYYLDNPGSDVPCQKCHADIYEELELSPLHKKWGNSAIADTSDCEACHRGNFSIVYANASAGQPGKEAHAASRTECMYCHGNTSVATFHNAPIAGGFGISDLPSDTGVNSTHFEMIVGTGADSNIYPGESEACILCHTNVKVRINFTSYIGYSITAENTITSSTSEWVIGGISPSNFIAYSEVKK